MSAMHPADVISEEHGTILRMTQVLLTLAEGVDRGDAVARADVRTTIQFFRDFVDLGHHEKEESVLIPELVRAGVDYGGDPLHKLREQHNQERYLVRALRQAGLQDTPWTLDDQKHFASVAKELVALQHAHLELEARVFIPLIRTHLPDARLAAVAEAFQRIDAERMDDARDAELDALASRVLAGS